MGIQHVVLGAGFGIGQAHGHKIQVKYTHHIPAEAPGIRNVSPGHVHSGCAPLYGGLRPDGIHPTCSPRNIKTLGHITGGEDALERGLHVFIHKDALPNRNAVLRHEREGWYNAFSGYHQIRGQSGIV